MKLVRNILLLAAAASFAIPAAAGAANRCEEVKHDHKVMGTLLGAAAGAFLGGAIAAHGHKGDGALVGAAGGAVVGNQMSRSKEPCGPDPQPVAYMQPMPPAPPMTSTTAWRDRYGRTCSWREETYYEEDGTAVRRSVERCEP